MKEKQIDIDKIVCPQKDKLIVKHGNITAKIVDEELDIINCTFNNDGCVEIDAKGYTYLVLSVQNLQTLIGLISEAEEKYKTIK